MPSDDERRADQRWRRAGLGWGRPSAAIVGCCVRRGRDLLPASQPRDRRLLLLLRAADLPRLHDADPGRDALPGVRQPAHQGDQGGRRAPACFASAPATFVLIALNVARLPGRDRQRQRRLRRSAAARSSATSASTGPRSPKASGTGCSPAASCTPASSTSPSTCSPSSSSAACWSRRSARLRFVALYFASLFGGAFGALLLEPGRAHDRRLRRDLRHLRRDLRDRPRPRRRRRRLVDRRRSC